jgi:hypothetical protein
MTSSQPPQPPLGGQPPHGNQPPQQPPPGYGPPPGQPYPGQQPPPPGYGPPPAYGQQPPGYGPPPGSAQNPYGQPAGNGGGFSFDPKRLKMADYVIAGLSLLYLVLSWFPWYDLGLGDFLGVDTTISGWVGSGSVKLAFFLFLLATVWALLPAFADVKVGFPRSWITVGLAALGFLLTLFAWFDTFSYDFSIWALLGALTAAGILMFAVLTLLPEVRNRPALPGALAGAAQWANQPAREFGPGQQAPGGFGRPTPPQAQPPQQYAPPPAPPTGAPPPPPGSAYGPPAGSPPAPGGAPAPGGSAAPDHPTGI